VLDAYAAELAAEQSDEEGIASVKRASSAFARAVGEPGTSVDRLIALDESFHTAIGRASNNPLLSGLLEALHGHLAQSRRLWLADTTWRTTAAKEHAAISDAIAKGDAEAARNAVMTHMTSVRRMLDSAQSAADEPELTGI
jgi:GntR family transcriptional repressor for pyruvate dehydrogenase complex